MQKVNPIFYAGLAYVQISSLPAKQFEFLEKHVPSVCRFRLIIEGENLEDCISYEDYEHWYQLINPQYFDNYFESQI
jgi:hypothetical protein